MPQLTLSGDQLERYASDGFFIVEGLLDAEELGLLRSIARADHELARRAASRSDGEGGAIRLYVENELREDIYGAIVRSRRVAETAQRLLGGEVYHYHHKLIYKEPRVGGAWAWHQDYGYWYHNGCLEPALCSCMIAIDRATRENGCLMVVRGSHHLGRLEHGKVGDQTGVADQARLDAILARYECLPCELEPGSAIFFHCNLLHRSDQNRSDQPRWAFIACYNARRNDPYIESRHPRYTPLDIQADSRIAEVGRRQWSDMQRTAARA
jgi:ectoine hydroxylase-related dioxygenase (phytanoyl-CoA dioxygenase family)